MTQQYVSVPTLVKTMYRMVEADDPQLCNSLLSSDSVSFREEALAKSRLPDPMVRLLAEMDRKLDAILGQMQRDNLRGDFPHDAWVVRLGGDALHLECKEPLLPGDHLELILLLEEYPLRAASCIVKVDRRLPEAPVTGKEHTAFVLSYTCLRESDRESIIRHVFQEERRRIRQLKSEEEGD